MFSKTSSCWIFADLALFSLRNYLKRCKFGFCDIWNTDKIQRTIYVADTWWEPLLKVILPFVGSIAISFFTTMNYLPNNFAPKELDSFQYFYIGCSALI